jgi:hypothetical protein
MPRHIRQLAENHNVPMPTMDVAHQHMLSARAHGGDQMDWTALVGGERISAGLQPFGSRVSLPCLPIWRWSLWTAFRGAWSFGRMRKLLTDRSDLSDTRVRSRRGS